MTSWIYFFLYFSQKVFRTRAPVDAIQDTVNADTPCLTPLWNTNMVNWKIRVHTKSMTKKKLDIFRDKNQNIKKKVFL